MGSLNMENNYFVGHDAMPRLGRVKSGHTPRPPKINSSGLSSETEYINLHRRSDMSETDVSTSEPTSTITDSITVSSFESLPPCDQSTPEPERIRTVRYDDRRRLERLCGILTKSSNEDLIEYTLIAIFSIFAYLIFTGHF